MAAEYKIVREAGANSPWLVMVHGMSQDHRVFSAQVDAFRKHHPILLIDLPGHGLSSDEQGPFGHWEMAGHGAAAMTAAGSTPCHYWATHTGTALGLLLASREPDDFISLILEGAVLPGHGMASVERELQRARDTARNDGMAAMVRPGGFVRCHAPPSRSLPGDGTRSHYCRFQRCALAISRAQWASRRTY